MEPIFSPGIPPASTPPLSIYSPRGLHTSGLGHMDLLRLALSNSRAMALMVSAAPSWSTTLMVQAMTCSTQKQR